MLKENVCIKLCKKTPGEIFPSVLTVKIKKYIHKYNERNFILIPEPSCLFYYTITPPRLYSRPEFRVNGTYLDCLS